MRSTTSATAATTASDACAAAAIAGETRAGNSCAVSAAIVFGDDLDVLMILTSIDVAVLDPTVREMDLAVEEWQVMIVRPLLDFSRIAIGPAIRIRPVPIPFLQPLLVLALQLVIEAYAVDLQTAGFELRRLAFVGPIDLGVVFEFALTFQTGVESLTRVPIAVAAGFQHAPAAVCQHHGLLAMAGDANGLDQPLLTEMSEIAVARIARPTGVVPKVTRRDDAKRSNRGKGSALRPAQGVFAVAGIVDGFPVASPREIQATCERLARIGASAPRVAIAFRPACIVVVAVVGTVTSVVPLVIPLTMIAMLLDRSRSPSERQPDIVIVAVTLIPIAVAWVALIAVIARIEIHTPPPRRTPFLRVIWDSGGCAREAILRRLARTMGRDRQTEWPCWAVRRMARRRTPLKNASVRRGADSRHRSCCFAYSRSVDSSASSATMGEPRTVHARANPIRLGSSV